MVKFHINPRGDVGRCLSEDGNCPFGGEHFSDAISAWNATETVNASLVIASPLRKNLTATSTRQRAQLLAIINELPESDPEEIYPVEDNWGDYSELSEGELSDDATWIMKNGQCLGFASELASAFGTNKIAVLHRTEESEDLVWDEEKDEPVLDEDGEEQFVKYENIVHAYAVAPDGKYWDIDGEHNSEKLDTLTTEKVSEYEAPEAVATYGSFMSNQNHEFSRSLIKPVLLAHLSRG